MKQKIFTLILLLFSITAFSQIDSVAISALQQKVGQLQIELKNQKSDFSKQITSANAEIESLRNQISAAQHATSQLADSLGIKISDVRTSAEQQLSNVDKFFSKTTLRTRIGVLFAVLFVGFVYWLLRRKQRFDKIDIVAQLSQTKQSIDEKLVNEFAKNTEALEALSQMTKPTQTAEHDHSLALKVADEITLMERNISFMNQDTKGLKPLIRAIERLQDNLLSKGYEMPELLGKPYIEGMRITITSSIPDETVEKGKDIITKIIKPQVNFNEKLIQTAQVEVKIGTK